MKRAIVGIRTACSTILKRKIDRIHPELEEHRFLINEKKQVVSGLKKSMLRHLAMAVEALDPSLPEGSDAYTRSSLIDSGNEADLTNPLEIIHTLSRTLIGLRSLETRSNFTEEELENVILSNSSILGKLIPVTTDAGKKSMKLSSASSPWGRRRPQVLGALVSIRKCLESVSKSDKFSVEKAEECSLSLRSAEEDHKRALGRIEKELLNDARVMMGTIGSSHKIPIPEKNEDDNIEITLDRLQISRDSGKETIVVFDEAGCIPSYELLGLSRMNRSIKALICVGDKHQLPPYAPNSMSNKRNPFNRRRAADQEQRVESLLDVSALEEDGDNGGKVTLNTQYRVPRDIATVLNQRIYNGKYCTPINCTVPSRGFYFVHVEYCHGGRKYENENEVKKCLELVQRYNNTGASMMILTPVSVLGSAAESRLKSKLY